MSNIFVDIWERWHQDKEGQREAAKSYEQAGKDAADRFAAGLESRDSRVRNASRRVLNSNASLATAQRDLTKATSEHADQLARVAALEEEVAERRSAGVRHARATATLQERVHREKEKAEKSRDPVRDLESSLKRQREAHVNHAKELADINRKIEERRLKGSLRNKSLDAEYGNLHRMKVQRLKMRRRNDSELKQLRSDELALTSARDGAAAAAAKASSMQTELNNARAEGIKANKEFERTVRDLTDAQDAAAKVQETIDSRASKVRSLERDRNLAVRAFEDALHAADGKGKRGKRGGHGEGAFGANALGGIFTSIPFVPGGKAGAVIGSGLMSVLGSVADVAVTASQALWLLPAAATAGVAAFGTLKLGMKGFGKAIQDMGNPKQFAKDLQVLAPAAQQAALEIQHLVSGMSGLQRFTQQALFKGVAAQLSGLATRLMPSIQKLMGGTAGAFNSMFSSAAQQLATPQTMGAISATVNNIVHAFQNLAPAMGPVVDAFARISQVGSSFLPGMASAISNAATKFANFITAAQQSGKLQQWIQRGIDAAVTLGHVLANIGRDIFNTFGNKTPGQFKSTLQGIASTATTVMNAIGGVSTVVNALLRPLNAVAGVLGGWPHLVFGAVAAFAAFKGITGVASLLTQLQMVASTLEVTLPEAAARGAGLIGLALSKGVAAGVAGILATLGGNALQNATKGNGFLHGLSVVGTDAAQGAAIGGGIASFIPGVGTVLGAGVGALTAGGIGLYRQLAGHGKSPSSAVGSGASPLVGVGSSGEIVRHGKALKGVGNAGAAAPVGPTHGSLRGMSAAAGGGKWQYTSGHGADGGAAAGATGSLGKKYKPWTVPQVPGAKGGAGSKTGTPKAALPYGSAYAARPYAGETPSEYSAAGAVLQAKHRLAQDRAELHKMETRNNSSAEQIQAQKNKIAKDQRAEYEAQLRLDKARQNATQKFTQGLQATTGSLNGLGPKLDQDFGLSQGLPGLAKNLVEFVATLAAAPLLGQLAALKGASPIKGGSGIFGMVGAANLAAGRSPILGIPAGMPGGPPGLGRAGMPVSATLASVIRGGGRSAMARSIYQSVLGAGYSPETALYSVAASMYESGLQPGITNASGHHGLFQESADKPSNGAAQQINWFLGALRGIGGPAYVNQDPRDAIANQVERGNYPGSRYTPLLGRARALVSGVPATTAGAVSGVPTATLASHYTPLRGNSRGFPGSAPSPQRAIAQPAIVGPKKGGGYQPQGGGAGIGGLPESAIIAGAGMFPGGGAAAQMGMQLINRTIKYGGQVAGIGMQGLLETFGLNDSKLSSLNNNIFGRILKGLAGAKPEVPTSAGKMDHVGKKSNQKGRQQGNKGANPMLNIERFYQSPDKTHAQTMADLHHLGAEAASQPLFITT